MSYNAGENKLTLDLYDLLCLSESQQIGSVIDYCWSKDYTNASLGIAL